MPKKRSHGNSRTASRARRARYIDAYMGNGQNGRQAAITAGIPEKNASAFVYQMLKNEEVQAQIKARLEELAAPLKLSAEMVLASLQRALLFDPRRLYNADGSLKSIHELDDDTALELAGHEVEEITRMGKTSVHSTKVKYPSKATARDQGMKHFGLYKKDNEQRVDDPDTIAAKVRARLAAIDDSTTDGGKK